MAYPSFLAILDSNEAIYKKCILQIPKNWFPLINLGGHWTAPCKRDYNKNIH
jgi:hypothetical protein